MDEGSIHLCVQNDAKNREKTYSNSAYTPIGYLINGTWTYSTHALGSDQTFFCTCSLTSVFVCYIKYYMFGSSKTSFLAKSHIRTPKNGLDRANNSRDSSVKIKQRGHRERY
jgi:hypothetical protein